MSSEEMKSARTPEQEPPMETLQTPGYRPRPKWQLVLAWVLLALTVVGTALYYFWIVYPY